MQLADVAENCFNVLREDDEVGDLDDSVSQAISSAVWAAVGESKTVKTNKLVSRLISVA